ncbi:hypothetical protein NJO91_33215 [Streptomyces microflavus]|uniref:hypothetical protein n=1 Tax=Streptomyces microflavus TaxID=1919 RepID=UPI0029A5C514|nr:hypothetical protein [Streptomyces microflavus]MDX2407975.1 hypothetical protein [Streptomyces microflavus]
MHADIHLTLHTDRAAELRHEAQEFRLPRARLRTRVGWTMVEFGLRLARSGASCGQTFRTA